MRYVQSEVVQILGTYENGPDYNRYFPNLCAFVIGMMLYMASNTRTDISFSVHLKDRQI